jgi:hypothetical protein
MSEKKDGVPLLFTLVRDEDESGISGTGTVADGVRWPDGSAALHWRTEYTSTAVYGSMEALRRIHGHGGRTRVVWSRGYDESVPFLRGSFHCILDDNENAPFGSTGGRDATENMRAPDYIAEADRDEYIAGYQDAAHGMYGDDWRTCTFSWRPVMTLWGEDDDGE